MATKIAFVARMRMPSERAHGIQIMRTCDALAGAGAEVTLYYSQRRQSKSMRGRDPFEYYGLEPRFPLKPVPILDMAFLIGKVPRSIWGASYAFANVAFGLTVALMVSFTRPDVFYTREWLVAWWLTLFGRPTILELHRADPQHMSGRVKWLLRRMAGRRSMLAMVTISDSLKAELIESGFTSDKLAVLRDAVDIGRYAAAMDIADARRRVGINPDERIVMYTGNMLPSKGVEVLVEAATSLGDVSVVIVGGPPDRRVAMEREAKRLGASNVRFLGHVPPAEVPTYQRTADVLVIPQLDPQDQSPMKLAEYMAARRPIVGSDLAPIREVITNGESGLLVPPGDAKALADGVLRLLADRDEGERLAAAAADAVANLTWERRAAELLDLVVQRA